MLPYRSQFLLILLGIAFAWFSPDANAQATRTWVAGGIGDDANPGSRTAPGKTFAGNVAKTAVGGVINVIEPGSYGAVTIPKSMMIDGSGTFAGILASGVTGVTINAPGGSVVLRELDINGTGTNLGVNGVRIVDAAVVYLDRCTISNFQTGIKVEGGGQVIVKDCVIRNCTIAGIDDSPTASALTEVHQTRVEGCKAGVIIGGNVRLTGTHVSVVGCEGDAVSLQAAGTATFTDSTFANNGAGLSSDGKMFVGTSLITNNVGAGLRAAKPGSIWSLKGNQLVGNTPDGKFSKSLPQR